MKSNVCKSGLVLMSILLLGTTVAPSSLAFASQTDDLEYASSEVNNLINQNTISYSNVELIGIDQFGNEQTYNPYSRFTSSVIYIGVKMKYTSKADGNKIIAVLNESYGMGTIGNAIGIFSGALGGLPGAVVGGFMALGFNGFRNRCKEGIAEIKAHPSKGAIYMYTDHVTWKAS